MEKTIGEPGGNTDPTTATANQDQEREAIDLDKWLDQDTLTPELKGKLTEFVAVCRFIHPDSENLFAFGLGEDEALDYAMIKKNCRNKAPSEQDKEQAIKLLDKLSSLVQSRILEWQKLASSAGSSVGEIAVGKAVEVEEGTKESDAQNDDMLLFQAAYIMMAAKDLQDEVFKDSPYTDRKTLLERVADLIQPDTIANVSDRERFNIRGLIFSAIERRNAAEAEQGPESDPSFTQSFSIDPKTAKILFELDDILPKKEPAIIELLSTLYDNEKGPKGLRRLALEYATREALVELLSLYLAVEVLQALEIREAKGKAAIDINIALQEHNAVLDQLVSEHGHEHSTRKKLGLSSDKYKRAKNMVYFLVELQNIKIIIKDFRLNNRRELFAAKTDLERLLEEVLS